MSSLERKNNDMTIHDLGHALRDRHRECLIGQVEDPHSITPDLTHEEAFERGLDPFELSLIHI